MSILDMLWHYQEADVMLTALNEEIASSDAHKSFEKLHKALTSYTNKIRSIEKLILAKKEEFSKLCLRVEGCELEYRDEKEDLELLLNEEECTYAEAAEATKSLENLRDSIAALRKQIFDMLSLLDRSQKEYDTTFEKARKAKRQYDMCGKQCEQVVLEKQPEVDRLKKEIEERGANIPKELLARYAAIKKQYAEPMAKIETNQCSGCHMSLPTTTVRKVAAGTSIVECENCGRILYSGN